MRLDEICNFPIFFSFRGIKLCGLIARKQRRTRKTCNDFQFPFLSAAIQPKDDYYHRAIYQSDWNDNFVLESIGNGGNRICGEKVVSTVAIVSVYLPGMLLEIHSSFIIFIFTFLFFISIPEHLRNKEDRKRDRERGVKTKK